MLLQNSEAMVSIDMPAGPSEVLVIADGGAPVAHVAADLLSQAEHGPDSQVRLLLILWLQHQKWAAAGQGSAHGRLQGCSCF